MEAAAPGHQEPDREGTEGEGSGVGGGPDGGDAGQRLTAAITEAYTAAVAASEALAARQDVDVDQVAREAVTEALAVLDRHGCITAPTKAQEPMTVAQAAKLLCRTSGTLKLNDPDLDYQQLYDSYGMVEYAWAATVRQGLTGPDLVQATAARRLLMQHHGRL